ncbi:hypothetical protein FRC20_008010 [Serendipita sp. 405]|nr:hypothetical protein FRC20_008010 [Serendipita sp. 405]
MQEIQHLLRLLNAPDVRRPTRAVFRSLLANCEDAKRLCSFVLESIRARVNERLQSEIVHRRRHHLPAIHMTEGQHAMLESEALNDEARRWMADFLLYPIGKRTRITRSSTRLLHKRTRHTQKSGSEDSATTARIQGEGIPETKGVLKRSGPHAPSTDVGGLAYEVKLFPKSDDPVRLSRFRVLHVQPDTPAPTCAPMTLYSEYIFLVVAYRSRFSPAANTPRSIHQYLVQS